MFHDGHGQVICDLCVAAAPLAASLEDRNVTFSGVMVLADVGVGWGSYVGAGTAPQLFNWQRRRRRREEEGGGGSGGGGICPFPVHSHYTVLPLLLLPGNRHCLK